MYQIRFLIKKSKMMLIFVQISLIQSVVIEKIQENAPGHVIYDRPNGLVYESVEVTSLPEM